MKDLYVKSVRPLTDEDMALHDRVSSMASAVEAQQSGSSRGALPLWWDERTPVQEEPKREP